MAYSNLAYDYDYDYEPSQSKQRKPQLNNTGNHKKMYSKTKNIRRICVIIALAVSAGFMISKFVTVHETQQEIASLERELAQEQSITSQQMFDLEQGMDLMQIEKEATTRLGMQHPEKYQTIYVNVKRDDVTEVTSDEVEGFKNRVASTLKSIGSYIVTLFSIE